MSAIFVDTWAWCALTNKGDSQHDSAKQLQKKMLERDYDYITTNYVIDESYTLIRSRVGIQPSIEFHNRLERSKEAGFLEISRINTILEKQAWEMFVKFDDVDDLSFTDCTSFALMEQRNMREVFTGDAHFQYAGFIKRNNPSNLS